MIKQQRFGDWLQQQMGCKVQKLPVDAGFTCPNRDGKVGYGGCTFCNNQSFVPSYCRSGDTIAEQLEQGKQFFEGKYTDVKYVAYFQSYSNTYAPLDVLRRRYEEALDVPDVVGLIISTRPDCVDAILLDYLKELSKLCFVLVEYGIESTSDETLRRVNRGHTYEQARYAVMQTVERGIPVGAHFILGFPWESEEDLMLQADEVARLPLTTLKLHQLQIVRGTQMARDYATHPWPMPTAEEYARLLRAYLQRLPSHFVVDRFVSYCPPDMLLAPRWGLKYEAFERLLSLE